MFPLIMSAFIAILVSEFDCRSDMISRIHVSVSLKHGASAGDKSVRLSLTHKYGHVHSKIRTQVLVVSSNTFGRCL